MTSDTYFYAHFWSYKYIRRRNYKNFLILIFAIFGVVDNGASNKQKGNKFNYIKCHIS